MKRLLNKTEFSSFKSVAQTLLQIQQAEQSHQQNEQVVHEDVQPKVQGFRPNGKRSRFHQGPQALMVRLIENVLLEMIEYSFFFV